MNHLIEFTGIFCGNRKMVDTLSRSMKVAGKGRKRERESAHGESMVVDTSDMKDIN